MTRRHLALCGSCLALVAVDETVSGHYACRRCGAKDERGPCLCGNCLHAIRGLLAGEPFESYEHGKAIAGRFWQRGVNWTRRGVLGQPVGQKDLLPYLVCDPDFACARRRVCLNHADEDACVCSALDCHKPGGCQGACGCGKCRFDWIDGLEASMLSPFHAGDAS